jgi:CheY-like chemotaxis protein
MKYSAGNLLSIVNDILDLSKIENGIIDIKSEKFNLKEIVETAFKTVESLIKENEVLLEFNFDESIPEFLNGDSLRLNQIFLNLLTNSAKFTAFGKIEFNIKKLIEENEQIQIQFEVNDTGIGIEENQLNQLFLPYSQEKNTNHRLKGTGLGLTITKKLVELLNGKIEVQSKVHFGTSFKILIPFNTSNELSNQSNLVEPYEVFQTKFKDLEILLVDDYETNLFVGKEILSLWNIIVDTATNGLEALEKTKLKKYDTILMDIQMPNLSGDETANLIKSDKENLNFNTPIIALSADVFNDVKERAIKAGMKGFVNKPFQLRELAEAISKNLKN